MRSAQDSGLAGAARGGRAAAGYRRLLFATFDPEVADVSGVPVARVEALLMLMHYGIRSLGITRFFAKIGEDNVASLALFKSMGYVDVNYVEAFREHELAVVVDAVLATTLETTAMYAKVPYERL